MRSGRQAYACKMCKKEIAGEGNKDITGMPKNKKDCKPAGRKRMMQIREPLGCK